MAKPAARGRPYNAPIAFVQKQAAKLHTAVYRTTRGRVGGRMLNSPVLLLVTTGRKTGRQRTTPLLYLKDGSDYVIVGSNGGTSGHPVWWLNLREKPEAAVEVGSEKVRVRAEEAAGEERRRLWERLVRMYPPYEDYQERTDREIPVILLKPAA